MGEVPTGVTERKGIRQRLLNVETHDAYGGLQTAIERSKRGLGTAVFCSHNTKNDMLAATLMLKKIPEFAGKEFVLPMNSMLYKAYWPGESLLGITLIPVHSPQVRKKNALVQDRRTRRELSFMDRITVPKDKNLDAEPSLQRYLAASKKALEHGGIVIVAPQAQGNMGKIDMTHQRRAFSKFLYYMDQYRDLDYSVLPIGVSYPESARKGRTQKGSHTGERMRIAVGKCYDRQEVTKGVIASGSNADFWMYSEIASLLPPEAVHWGDSRQRISS